MSSLSHIIQFTRYSPNRRAVSLLILARHISLVKNLFRFLTTFFAALIKKPSNRTASIYYQMIFHLSTKIFNFLQLFLRLNFLWRIGPENPNIQTILPCFLYKFHKGTIFGFAYPVGRSLDYGIYPSQIFFATDCHQTGQGTECPDFSGRQDAESIQQGQARCPRGR